MLGGAYLIVLGRFLGPSDFGVFSAVMAIVSVIGQLLEMRLQEVVARDFCHFDEYVTKRPESASQLLDLFALEVLARFLSALVILVFAKFLAQAINLESNSIDLLMLAAIGFFLSKSANSVSNGLLRVLGRTDLIALCMTIDWGARLVVTLIVIYFFNLDTYLVFLIAIIIGFLANVILIWFAYHEFSSRVGSLTCIKWSFIDAIIRLMNVRRLILTNWGVSCADLMAKDLDVAVISNIVSAEKVGLYKMAKSFVQVLWRVIDPFLITIMPELLKLWQLKKFDEAKILIRKTTFRLFLFALAVVLAGDLFLFLFIDQLLGTGYETTISLVLIMSIWIPISAPLIWGSALAIAIGRPEISLVGTIVGMIVGLISFKVLVPTYELIGAAIAWNLTLISGFVFIAAASVMFVMFIKGSIHGL
jgi:O-antigen/teichoic acid export membrane protein